MLKIITMATGPKASTRVRVKSSPRGGIVASKGKLILSVDYKAQEIATAAAYSKDAIMERALLSPEKIVVDGVEYKNPDADLHTLTAVNVCFREVMAPFASTKHLWVAKADNTDVYQNAKGESARQISKKVNFTEIYLASAQTLAELLNIPLDTAKTWASNFTDTYSGYYEWAQNVGKIAEVRGYARTLWVPRVRWVQESNAKKAGESPIRSAVNFSIQGECANQLKMSMVRLDDMLFGGPVTMLPPVHDEMVFEIPGEAYLDEANSKWDGDILVKPKYTYNDEAKYWDREISAVIRDTQTECFQALNSPIKGAVESGMAPYWAH